MTNDARISTALPQHPKTKKLMKRLGAAGPLWCIYLFLWAAANKPDGDLSGMSDDDIELAVDWAGEDGAFVAAMVDVGFLDGEEGTRVIHDWAEHNPWAAGSGDRSDAGRWGALCRRYGEIGAAERMPEYASRRGISIAPQKTAEPIAENRSAEVCEPQSESLRTASEPQKTAERSPANRMPIAKNRTAPYPTPTPTPTPTPNPEIQPPPPPHGGGHGPNAGNPSEAFERFWAEWPRSSRKVAKGQCWAKWLRKGCEDFAEQVIDAVKAAKASRDWTKAGGEFIPAPLVWLNQDRWQAASAGGELWLDTAPTWAIDAGFRSVFDAENAGCYAHNAHEFHGGHRITEAA